jgi:multiple antibiotic resistance protein
MGFELLRAQYKKLSDEEQEEAEMHSDVAVVPLALPILSGPGAMGAVIVASDKGNLLTTLPMQGLSIGFVMVVTWLCLRSAQYIGTKLGVTGINIMNRVLGLLIVALGFEFLLNGLKSIWFG